MSDVNKNIEKLEKSVFELEVLYGFNGPFNADTVRRLKAIQKSINGLIEVNKPKTQSPKIPCGDPGCVGCQDKNIDQCVRQNA